MKTTRAMKKVKQINHDLQAAISRLRKIGPVKRDTKLNQPIYAAFTLLVMALPIERRDESGYQNENETGELHYISTTHPANAPTHTTR